MNPLTENDVLRIVGEKWKEWKEITGGKSETYGMAYDFLNSLIPKDNEYILATEPAGEVVFNGRVYIPKDPELVEEKCGSCHAGMHEDCVWTEGQCECRCHSGTDSNIPHFSKDL